MLPPKSVWVIALSFVALNVAAAQTPRFVSTFSISPEPQFAREGVYWNISDIAAGDIDGDGKPDLVIGVEDENNNNPPNYLEWLKGNGGGTFVVKQFAFVDANPWIQLADMNGDGILDLVTAGTELDVYLGNGDGTFKAPVRYLQNVAGGISQLFVGNFNGQPLSDVAIKIGSNIQILLNQGNGTLQTGQNLTVPGGVGVILGSADFNGDRQNDLAVYSNQNVFVLPGAGNGTFKVGASFFLPAPLSFAGHPAQIIDANRDGHPDVVLALTDRAQVLLSNGDGTFRGTGNLQHPLYYVASPGDSINSQSVMKGDFNHDGILDFAVGPSVYFGKGDGTFAISKFYSVSGRPEISFDLNKDGYQDLIWVDRGGDCCGGLINVALGGGGQFRAPIETVAPDVPGIVGSQPLFAGDFNRDGISDIAIRCQGGKLCIFPGTGKGYFNSSTVYPTLFTGLLATGDVNGDGILDLVATNDANSSANSDITVLIGRGDGTFKTPETYTVFSKPGAGNTLALVDLNNDHKLDLVGEFGVTLGNGDGTFQAAKPLTVSFAPFNTEMAVADFNHDGIPDLAISNEGSIVYIFLGDGTGNFPNTVQYHAPGPIDGMNSADVNKDGIPDLLFSMFSGSSPNLAVALGNGDGTFKAPALYPYPAHYCCFDGDKVLLADLDNDGITGAVVTAYGVIEYFRGLAGGTFAASSEFANSQTESWVPPVDRSEFTFIDVNGDGYLDMAIADQFDGFARLMNSGLPPGK